MILGHMRDSLKCVLRLWPQGLANHLMLGALQPPNSEPPQVVLLNISIKVVSPVRNRKKTRAREDGDLG